MLVRHPLVRPIVAFVAALAMVVGVLVVQDVPVAAAVTDGLLDDLSSGGSTVPGISSPPLDDPATMPEGVAEWPPPLVELEAPAVIEEVEVPDAPLEQFDLVAADDTLEVVELPPFEHGGFVEGSSTEAKDERTATMKVFDNPDGTQTARLFSGIVHAQDATGAWVDVDTTLAEGAEGLLVPGAAAVGVALAPTTVLGPVATTSDEGRSIAFGLADASSVAGVVRGSSVRYGDVWSDSHVILTALVDGVKSELVLDSADAPTRFEFPLVLEGLTPSLDEDTNVISYLDGDGDVAAFTPAGFMFDSNIDAASGEAETSMGVGYDLVPVGDGAWTLVVTLDDAWLSAPERVFPVTVDPTARWARHTSAADMYVDNRTGGSGQELEMLKVGTWNGGYNRRRSFLKWDTSSLAGKDIVSGHIWMVNHHSYSCLNRPVDVHRVTQSWVYSSTWSWPGPTVTSTPIAGSGRNFAEGHSSSCPDSWVPLEITDAVKRWASGSWGSYGVMIKADNETDSYGWKKFWSANLQEEDYGLPADAYRPYLEVHYNRPPVINSLSPASATGFHALSRTISVSASDPDGGSLEYRWVVSPSSSLSGPGTTVLDWGPSTAAIIDVGESADWNQWLWWRVDVQDSGGLITSSYRRSIRPYNSRASVSHSAPASGALLHDLTPTLKVNVSDSEGDKVYLQYQVRNGSGTVVAESAAMTGHQWTVPSGELAWNRSYQWRVLRREILNVSGCSNSATAGHKCELAPSSGIAWRGFETVNAQPGVPGPLAPGVDEVLTSLPVGFAASTITDPDGDAVRYQFQVASGDDGQTGRLATSGWLTGSTGEVSWTPPAGALADGGEYSWVVRARDSNGFTGDWSDPHEFEVDLQLGRRATSPFDQLGPASVNLINGNLVVEAGGPAYPTVGPPVGVGFTYNSRTPVLHGLTARFHQDADKDGQIDGSDPLQVRRVDRHVNYNWKSGSPNSAALAGDHWIGRWTGTLRVPPGQESTWVIEATSSDPLWVDVAGTRRLTTNGGAGVASTAFALSASPTPIEVQFAESTGSANLTLKIRRATDPSSEAFVIPADWFLPEATVLPGGWSTTGLVAGGAGFTSVTQPTDDTVVLVDASGATHRFSAAEAGGWTAPDTLPDTAVTRLDDGTVTATSAAGWLHRFDVNGDLVEVTPPDDNLDPSALSYTFTNVGGQSRMTSMVDATGRTATLAYGPDASCPTDTVAGLERAPDGMLCRIDYLGFGGGSTGLLYEEGHLARIVNPGQEITDFGYDDAARLIYVRDALRNDLGAAGIVTDLKLASGAANPVHATEFSYDPENRVATITAPVPHQTATGTDRVVRRYTYGDGQTDVDVDGLVTPAGFIQRAAFDVGGRMTAVTDAAGLTTSYEWDDEDRMVATVDAAGLRSTTTYDDAGFAVATHGPSPAAWFDGLAPSSAAPGEVPTSTTDHDTGLAGLTASWFDNDRLLGTPAARTLVANGTSWGPGSPHAAVPPDGFSGRLTGGIELAAAGVYTLALASGLQGRVYLDDELVYDSWDGPVVADGTTAELQSEGHKLTVEYRHLTGSASLELAWKTPGTSTAVTVPGTLLEPRLGLPYKSTDSDGHTVATGYVDPVSGRATTITVDPVGLALAEVSTYETPGVGSYGRPTSLTLPSGGATTSYSYYTDGFGVGTGHACVAARGVDQGGALMLRSGPDPDRVERYVYDGRGNRVGARISIDGVHNAWRCSSYDDRGRLVSTTDPDGRTTTHDYSDPTKVVTTYLDSSDHMRSTVAQVDWAGRPVAYTDEHGTTHRTVYDRFGHAVETHRKFAGGTETLLVERDFDGAGRIRAISDLASGSARETMFTYDEAGRLETTQRPNDVDSTAAYDAETGHLVGVTHTSEAGTTILEDWAYRYTTAGRIDAQTGRGQSRIHTYDGAGRLIQAQDKSGDPDRALDADEEPTVRQYGYDANSNRCSHTTGVCDGSYTYGVDDRILSSPYATDYRYDARGNVVGWTPVESEQPAGSGELRTGVELEPDSDVQTFDLPVRSAGTVTANLAADSLPTAHTTGQDHDSLAPAGQAGDTVTIPLAEVDEDTSVDVDLTWLRGAHEVTESTRSATVSPAFDAQEIITPTAAGPLTVSVDWPRVDVITSRTGTIGAAATRTVNFDVSGTGTVTVDLNWTKSIALENLDLQVYDADGVLRGSSTDPIADSERVVVTGVNVPYPQSERWQVVVRSLAATSVDYQVQIVAPETPEIDITVTDPVGAMHAPSGGAFTKPEVVTLHVPDDEAYLGGDYVVTVETDLAVTYRLTPTYWELDHADLEVELLDPSGSVLDTASGATGELSVSATNRVTGNVAVRVTNRSSDLDVPRATAWWAATTLEGGSDAGPLAPGASRTATVTADGAGPLPVELSWTQSADRRRYTSTGATSSMVSLPLLQVDGVGDIDASVGWTTRDQTRTRNNQTVTSSAPDVHSFSVTGNGTLTAELTDAIPGSVELELLDPSGNVQASTNTLAGGTLTHLVYGSRTLPQTWTLRVTTALPTSTSYGVEWSWPAQTNMDIEILDASGTVLAGSTSTASNGPDKVTHTITEPGGFQARLHNRDGRTADYNVTVDYPDRAQVRVELRDPTGTLLETATGSAGTIAGDWAVPDAGDYTLTVVNLDTALDVPSYDLSWEAPIDRSPIVAIRLLDTQGGEVASVQGEAHTPDFGPALTLTAEVQAGDHVLEVTRVRRSGSAELAVDYPGPRLAPTIVYDANDHATVIDDGITKIAETLSPEGRVIARVVTDSVTGELLEHVSVGYAASGDNRAYEIIHQDGADPVVTYIGGPDGLLTIDTAGTAVWPLDDGHGHTLGVVDDDGGYSPNPVADEFGVMPDGTLARGEDSLDWLGGEMRHRTGDHFGLIRMGVRLYDPGLGRFLSVDPVDGGSANTYDYCNADPINCRDLTGLWTLTGVLRGAGRLAAAAVTVAAIGAVCGATAGIGCAIGVGIIAGAASSAALNTGVDALEGKDVSVGSVGRHALSGAASGAFVGLQVGFLGTTVTAATRSVVVARFRNDAAFRMNRIFGGALLAPFALQTAVRTHEGTGVGAHRMHARRTYQGQGGNRYI